MDTLIAHLALEIGSLMVRRLLTLFARPTQQAMPNKALDKVGVQVHAFTVDHDVAFGALERIIRLCHAYHAFKADLALFSVA